MRIKSIFLIWLVIFFPLNNLPSYGGGVQSVKAADVQGDCSATGLFDLSRPATTAGKENPVKSFTDCFSVVSEEAMKFALSGYAALNGQGKILKKDIITIVDFSKPSTQERLFVINLKTKEVMIKSLCAHGRNSGNNWAHNFSNAAESYQSSLGFFIASETYDGKHGYSLKLDGQEDGINDNARERGVVMHAADYVSRAFIQATGRLGRSQGCPALPVESYQKIISLIKGGSCLFIYHPDKYYTSHSPILKSYNESCLAEVVSSFSE